MVSFMFGIPGRWSSSFLLLGTRLQRCSKSVSVVHNCSELVIERDGAMVYSSMAVIVGNVLGCTSFVALSIL